MANEFGSISDLIKAKQPAGTDDAATPPPAPVDPHPAPAATSSNSVQAQYDAKMRDIEVKGKERDAQQKAQTASMPYMNLHHFPIGPDTLKLIPEEISKDLQIIPFFRTAKEVRIGVVDPATPGIQEMREKIEDHHHVKTFLYIISIYSLEDASKLYETVPKYEKVTYGVQLSEEDLKKFAEDVKHLDQMQSKMILLSATDIVAMLFAGALEVNSSDVHIETEENGIQVRYRIDGILHTVATLPKEIYHKLISRIKIISGLKLNITNKPQDGRFSIHMTEGKIDVRVSVLPTSYGESVVVRILASTSKGITFEDLGIRGRAHDQLAEQIKRPNGLILTTGPTGSGKSTSLYAIILTLNSPDTKIITIEDPVEHEIPGVNQSQVDPSKGYTFANGLRSIVRQDPDIILVGEIRDLETAEIAIQAALTGHLVLSTLHTNDAAGTIPRLLSMGTKPFLMAPAINAMIGQRLVRRICSNCKTEYTPDEKTMEQAKKVLSAIPKDAPEVVKLDLDHLKFFQGKGCEVCHKIGYKGRVGIYEVMTMNKDIEKLILGGKVSEGDMQDIALKGGMITMVQDGILKALDGMTTLEEIFRVAE